MNRLKNKSIIICTALYCAILHTMETKQKIKPKNEWTLLECVRAKEIELVENILPSTAFEFIPLIEA